MSRDNKIYYSDSILRKASRLEGCQGDFLMTSVPASQSELRLLSVIEVVVLSFRINNMQMDNILRSYFILEVFGRCTCLNYVTLLKIKCT